MNPTGVADQIDVLNRLFGILYRSLPVYLAQVKPWSFDGGQKARAIETIAADQLRLAQRLARAIVDQGGQVDAGQFPSDFPAKHDLGVDYLVRLAAQHQRRDLEVIRRCVAELDKAPHLRALAEEVLGSAQGHLETLEEMMNDER